MTTVNKYRIFCNTDAKFEYVWAETEPTTCPTNTAHTINTTKTSIIDTSDSNVVTVKEESTLTGGHFGCETFKVTAEANAVGTYYTSWPIPVSALVITFATVESHKGNFVDIILGKNCIIGAITASVSPASAWTAQNYTVGQKVTYTDTIGNRPYTCIANTTNNAVPTNKTYWILGFELNVSSTVTQNTQIGFYLKLDNFVTNDDMGRVLYKNSQTGKVYMENNITNSYSAYSPTYVRQNVYILKDYELSEPCEHNIGQSKIGGAYIPADTKVTADYTNNTDASSSIVGRVEFLY